ncbi:MAG TPA: AAA family ATPase [Jatrophihabitans sp.]|jgi:hypothetical protein|nr:AAA family ATPase [Jatrophihabitans sp.]
MAFTVTGLARTAALHRLEWVLDGLNAAVGWGHDAAAVLDAGFLQAIAPVDYAELTGRRAHDFAPVSVTAVEVGEHTARARLDNHADGARYWLTCTVAPDPPHRIVSTSLQAEIPDGLTPRLPTDFTGRPINAQWPGRLIVFAGVPGAGKSTLADAVGHRLGVPVFAIDWLLGALTPFGGGHLDQPLDVGYEQLTTLALRQLSAGQSAILDAPVEDERVRHRWSTLAAAAGTSLVAFVTVCGDPAVHRRRLATRDRGIPGWHQGGDWADVTRRLASFPAWPGAVVLDTRHPLDDLVATVLDHLSRQDGPAPSGSV